MLYFMVRRALQGVILVVAVSVIVFSSIHLIGNPVDVLTDEEQCDTECRQRTMEAFGFDKPLYIQYFYFVGRFVQGDLGTSFRYHRSAMQLIGERLPATLELAFCAWLIAVAIGIPLGLYAGLQPQTRRARTIMAGSICGFSLPNFWVGLVLIVVFAVILGWLPASGRGETADFLGMKLAVLTRDGLAHLVLPSVTLATTFTAVMIRLTQASVRDVMPQDFVRFARAKGLSERHIIVHHVLRNIMVPITTVMGLQIGSLVAFGVVTETVFAYPGMGKLLIDSIYLLDRPVIVAWLMIVVVLFTVISFTVDVLYSLLDPRVRVEDMG